MPRRAKPTIIEFVTDRSLLNLSISPAQETLLRAIYALPMTGEQIEIFKACTGRERPPSHPFAEVTVIAGARSGKDSRIAATVSLYEAIFGEHRLARGETRIIPIVATGARGAKVAYDYILGYVES